MRKRIKARQLKIDEPSMQQGTILKLRAGLECDQPRLFLAARYTEFNGHLRKRFLKAYLLETGHPQLSSGI